MTNSSTWLSMTTFRPWDRLTSSTLLDQDEESGSSSHFQTAMVAAVAASTVSGWIDNILPCRLSGRYRGDQGVWRWYWDEVDGGGRPLKIWSQGAGGVFREGTTVEVTMLPPAMTGQLAALAPWAPLPVVREAGEQVAASVPAVPLGCREMTTGVRLKALLSRRGTAPVGVPADATHVAGGSALGVGSRG